MAVWRHPVYSIGYCEERSKNVRTVISYGYIRERKGAKMRWTVSNKQHALNLLEKRIIDFCKRHNIDLPNVQYSHVVRPEDAPVLLSQALRIFVELELSSANKWIVQAVKQSLGYYCDKDFELSDIEGIQKHIDFRYAHSKFAKSTQAKRMSYANRFFDFLVRRNWIERNPFSTLKTIRVKKRNDDAPAFTHREMQMIIADVRHRNRPAGLVLEFLWLTGCRINEALTIKREDILSDTIKIVGKGGHVRYFPLTLFPRLREVVDESLKVHAHEEKLFTYNNRANIGDALRESCDRIGIVAGRRSLHAIRAGATNYWEQELSFDIQTTCDLAGHSIAIREKHYRNRMKGAVIVERLERMGKIQSHAQVVG